MTHFGMPGPGGSMGQCAVCGGNFAAGVLCDWAGLPSGIRSFNVGFVEQTLYCHDSTCVGTIQSAFGTRNPEIAYECLPDGPLKTALGESITRSGGNSERT